jgi:hypothetical protein
VTWSVRDVIFVTCLLAVFGAVAYATTRRKRCINCGTQGTADELYVHHCSGPRVRQTIE